jgi:hypothetical protein
MSRRKLKIPAGYDTPPTDAEVLQDHATLRLERAHRAAQRLDADLTGETVAELRAVIALVLDGSPALVAPTGPQGVS